MTPSEEHAHAYVDQLVIQARERAAQAQSMAAEMETLRVTGQSEDGQAEITLTSTGALVDLYVGPSLAGAGGEAIRTSLMQANGAAQRRLSAQAVEVTARHFGADSDTTREFAERYAGIFGGDDDGDGDGTNGGGSGVLR